MANPRNDLSRNSAIFAALRRSNRRMHDLAKHVALATREAREDVTELREQMHDVMQYMQEKEMCDRTRGRRASVLAWTMTAAFAAAAAAALCDVVQHRRTAADVVAAIDALHPDLTDDATEDPLAAAGLPAAIQCGQVPNGRGGADIRFSATRTPASNSPNGTSYTVAGTLRADGRLTWSASSRGASEAAGKKAPLAEKAVRRIAIYCKRALGNVPGIAG